MKRFRFQLVREPHEFFTRIEHLGTKRGERDMPRCPREKRGSELRLQTHQGAARRGPSEPKRLRGLRDAGKLCGADKYTVSGQFFHRDSLKK